MSHTVDEILKSTHNFSGLHQLLNVMYKLSIKSLKTQTVVHHLNMQSHASLVKVGFSSNNQYLVGLKGTQSLYKGD